FRGPFLHQPHHSRLVPGLHRPEGSRAGQASEHTREVVRLSLRSQSGVRSEGGQRDAGGEAADRNAGSGGPGRRSSKRFQGGRAGDQTDEGVGSGFRIASGGGDGGQGGRQRQRIDRNRFPLRRVTSVWGKRAPSQGGSDPFGG